MLTRGVLERPIGNRKKAQNNTIVEGISRIISHHLSGTLFNIVQGLQVGIRSASALISIIFVDIFRSVPHIWEHKFAIYMGNVLKK